MRQFYGIGVAVALGEIPLERIAESDICANYSLYSSVASTSSGVELQNCEIIVLGNSPQSASDYDVSGGANTRDRQGWYCGCDRLYPLARQYTRVKITPLCLSPCCKLFWRFWR
uniref:Ring-opening amidohydrolase n=1 Tax=Desertifilum tharense IPPAS B-1220 TaxID=1781255 RepID=A0ACD5GPV7_9CYAN